jgi:hypothetical protein
VLTGVPDVAAEIAPGSGALVVALSVPWFIGPLAQPEQNQPDHAQARGEQADGQDDPAWYLVAGDHRGLARLGRALFASEPARAQASQRQPWFLYVDTFPCHSKGLSSGRWEARWARSFRWCSL